MASTFSNILFHVIFSTKHRQPLINPALRERLYPFIGGITRDEGGSLLSVGGVEDHIHLLVRWRTDRGVADLVRNIKSRSSAWIHEEFPDTASFAWQSGYAVFSVSESSRDSVIRYIEHQEEHHRVQSFKEELIEFLDRHGVEYDERFIVD